MKERFILQLFRFINRVLIQLFERMTNQVKTKVIRKFGDKKTAIRYLLECPSDSEGFQITASQRIQSMPIPDFVERLIQNLVRKESEEKKKAQKKVQRKRSVKKQVKIEVKQNQNDSEQPKPNLQTSINQTSKIQEKSPNIPKLPKSQRTDSLQIHQNQNSSIPKSTFIRIEDTLPKVFSLTLKDDSIIISPDGKSASVNPMSIEGKVLIDFPIKSKVSWQLRLSKQTEQATLGICQIKISPITGQQTIMNIDAIDKKQEINNFSYGNGQTVQLTFDPITQMLGFFNAAKVVSTKLRASPKIQGFDYYPYIFLKKGTVFLEMNWLINQIKKQQNK